jgi:hypothetical protein
MGWLIELPRARWQTKCMGVAVDMRELPMRRPSGTLTLALATIAAVGVPMTLASAALGGDGVPPSRQVVIVMRSLAYDGNLKRRAGDAINIVILHKKGSFESESMASVMGKAFGALEATQVSGLPIVVSRLAFTGAEPLKKAVVGGGIDVIYVCEGLDAELIAIQNVSHQTRALTVAGKRSYVERGLSLGVFEIDAKCTILLNLSASRMEGAAFAPDLLRLAQVIR